MASLGGQNGGLGSRASSAAAATSNGLSGSRTMLSSSGNLARNSSQEQILRASLASNNTSFGLYEAVDGQEARQQENNWRSKTILALSFTLSFSTLFTL